MASRIVCRVARCTANIVRQRGCSRLLCTAASQDTPLAAPPLTHVLDADDSTTVGFITDVEGNLSYFQRCVEASSVLRWADDSAKAALELQPGCCFVFGGDAFDKGVGDLRIANMLVDLKDRHPSRVALLIGNRDANKMKLTSELHASDISRPVDDIPAPYWMFNEKYATSLRTYLERKWRAATGASDNDYPDDGTLQELHTRENRLHYLLNHQMGCFNTFEFRRRELAALQGAEPSGIDDATVVESMYAIARDRDGAARRYLSRAQLAVIAGDSLCVHGAVTATNMGFVPDDSSGDRPQAQPPGHFVAADEGVEQWVTQLNEFARRGVQQWQQHMTWDASRTFRGGHALMGYGYRKAMGGKAPSGFGSRSVMVASFMGAKQHPDAVHGEVCRYLVASGIHRIMSGHQPFGDVPAILRSEEGTEVIAADTSFSDPRRDNQLDTRGVAVADVSVRAGACRVRGVRRDGSSYDMRLPPQRDEHAAKRDPYASSSSDIALIGQHTACGWWVSCIAYTEDSEPRYLLRRGQGFKVEERIEDKATVLSLLL